MTAEIIKFDPKFRQAEDTCSFCQTTRSKAKKLISNNAGKFICDKCVLICKEQINANRATQGVSA